MPTNMPIELDQIRLDISDTDQQLLGLLSKRRALALSVAEANRGVLDKLLHIVEQALPAPKR